jgi:spore maturation protein CgeB
MLRHLTHRDLKLYGVGWDEVGPELASCFNNEPVYGLKKTKIYSCSKISINVQRSHMIHGENFRVFEVAACRGVSFSTFKPDLVACFEPGEEIVVFEDEQDLLQLVDYYLNHPNELDKIAEAGRQRALAEHTYDHRAQFILEQLGSN